ncbi:MAG: cation:proton antiporter, partial [Myxococcales bacterium]|nr:cation:proton antiporter [Myxococcales bacterium]
MHPGLLSDLAIVTIVAAGTGLLTRRLGQPSVLGYLFAGLIVGPYIPIPLFADPQRMTELAEVGVVLVMFAVGLEFRVRRLLEIIPVSGLTAVAQIAALWWAGFTVGNVLDWTTAASICLGATLAISSTMVVSAVLRARPVDPDVRSHVFGILVVQDVVAIVLMALVTALAAGETVGLRALGLLLGQLTGAVAAMLIVGLLILPRLIRYALKQADTEVLVVLIAGAAFGLAMAANEFGYSVALGAFISGMAVAESGRGHEVEATLEPLRGLFSAIFFVSIGMSVDPVVAWRTLPFALLLCAVVVGMQFVAVTLTTVLTGSSLRRGIYSGLALGQIGELSFILATIAIGGGVVPEETLPALVTVATITAFTTPLLLGRAQPIVEAIDRMLPARAHQVLASYQSFIRESRTSPEAQPLRRPAIAVLLDWAALLVLFIGRHTVLQHVDPELEA